MANLKTEHWSSAINHALKGNRMLERLDKLIDDEVTYEKDFGLLSKKLSHRMKEAWKKLDFHLRFYRHSDVPEEGLAAGTMITHIDRPFGDGGIFESSKVFMYEFKRGDSIKGVIINKKVQAMRIGGPVGLRKPIELTDKIILHNIPEAIPRSTRVIPGVSWHDGPKSDLAAYENDARYKIHEYYGFASWFEG